MGFTPKIRRAASMAVVPLIVTAWIIGVPVRKGRTVHAGPAVPASGRTIVLGTARADAAYAVTVSAKDPAQLQGNDAVRVVVSDAQGEVESKLLHTADLDFYLTLRPRAAGPVKVSVSADAGVRLPEVAATMNKVPEGAGGSGPAAKLHRGVIAAAPNGTWETAQHFELGQTIFGSDDERPYAPAKSEDGYAAMIKGFQWFRFTFRESQPKLVYFVLNVTDRDVPLDVDIFQPGKDSDGKPDAVPFSDGEFVYKIEATQN
jgi:hypothetical protein